MKYERNIVLPALKIRLDRVEQYKELQDFINYSPNATRIIAKRYTDYGIFSSKMEISTDVLSQILDELIERETQEIERHVKK